MMRVLQRKGEYQKNDRHNIMIDVHTRTIPLSHLNVHDDDGLVSSYMAQLYLVERLY